MNRAYAILFLVWAIAMLVIMFGPVCLMYPDGTFCMPGGTHYNDLHWSDISKIFTKPPEQKP